MKTQTKTHRWSEKEESVLLSNRHLSPQEIKKRFFSSAHDISITALTNKMSRIIGNADFPRSKEPWSKEELEFLKNNLDLENEAIQKVIPRHGKQLDQMRFNLKRGKTPRGRGKSNKKLLSLDTERTLQIAELQNAIRIIKNAPLDVINSLRPRPFKDNPEIVAIHDYLSVPLVEQLHKNDPRKILLTEFKKATENRIRTMKSLPSSKSSAVSTFQNNILRMISGVRVTSFQQQTIHGVDYEIQALVDLLTSYLNRAR